MRWVQKVKSVQVSSAKLAYRSLNKGRSSECSVCRAKPWQLVLSYRGMVIQLQSVRSRWHGEIAAWADICRFNLQHDTTRSNGEGIPGRSMLLDMRCCILVNKQRNEDSTSSVTEVWTHNSSTIQFFLFFSFYDFLRFNASAETKTWSVIYSKKVLYPMPSRLLKTFYQRWLR